MGKLVRFSRMQLITMGAIIGMGLLNPLSVAVLEDYFKLVYTVISVGCAVWVVGYLLKTVLTPVKVNIPKNKKSKLIPEAYIET